MPILSHTTNPDFAHPLLMIIGICSRFCGTYTLVARAICLPCKYGRNDPGGTIPSIGRMGRER